ncbi:MAG: hypothetical protein IJK80_07490, partial [Firmicutes bacterium]|nr:hypothetical protein [Bacillota bacterium]
AGASAGADPADFAKNWKLVGPYVVVGVIFCLPVLDWLKALLSRFNLGKRILRFLENICLGSSAVGYRTESLHGAGSPQAQRIMIARQGNMEGKKKLAKKIAGIEDK